MWQVETERLLLWSLAYVGWIPDPVLFGGTLLSTSQLKTDIILKAGGKHHSTFYLPFLCTQRAVGVQAPEELQQLLPASDKGD